MQEEERYKWELNLTTTRQGRHPEAPCINFPAKHAFEQLMVSRHWTHRKTPPVATFVPVKPVVTCRESQFSDFASFTGPMTRKNGEIPTYTQQIHKMVIFTLSQQHKLELLRREAVLTLSRLNRWREKGDDESSVTSGSSATQTARTAPGTKRRSRFFHRYWQPQIQPFTQRYQSGSSIQ